MFINWLYHLFNPHCQHCQAEVERQEVCQGCEYLKIQIALLQQERDKLLNQILTPTLQPEANQLDQAPQPLNTSRFIPFSVKRQELEKADRLKAQQISEDLKNRHKENIEELEKEILEARVIPIAVGGANSSEVIAGPMESSAGTL